MKTLQILAFVFTFVLTSQIAVAQSTATIEIKTSAQCEMCKDRIEKAMAYERGVKSAVLNLETKILTIEYKVSKTSPEQLREAVSKIGYDADDVPADEHAYSLLPDCCQHKQGCSPGCGGHH